MFTAPQAEVGGAVAEVWEAPAINQDGTIKVKLSCIPAKTLDWSKSSCFYSTYPTRKITLSGKS